MELFRLSAVPTADAGKPHLSKPAFSSNNSSSVHRSHTAVSSPPPHTKSADLSPSREIRETQRRPFQVHESQFVFVDDPYVPTRASLVSVIYLVRIHSSQTNKTPPPPPNPHPNAFLIQPFMANNSRCSEQAMPLIFSFAESIHYGEGRFGYHGSRGLPFANVREAL